MQAIEAVQASFESWEVLGGGERIAHLCRIVAIGALDAIGHQHHCRVGNGRDALRRIAGALL